MKFLILKYLQLFPFGYREGFFVAADRQITTD